MEHGRAIRRLDAAALRYRRHESAAFFQRYDAMTAAEQQRYHDDLELRDARKNINRAIAELRRGELPLLEAAASQRQTYRSVAVDPERMPVLETIRQCYAAAYDRGYAAWRRDIRQTPIDDAAWARELERRRRLNTRHPPLIADARARWVLKVTDRGLPTIPHALRPLDCLPLGMPILVAPGDRFRSVECRF